MPSKAYGKFQKNLETVQRLIETYEIAKGSRNSKGKGAFDHITRSAIVFLISAFEVYCEDILCESVEVLIASAKDACNLPRAVKKHINAYVRNENNHVPPTSLCDEGWRSVYRQIAKIQADHLNSPKVKNLKEIFEKLLGIFTTSVDSVKSIEKLDGIIEFRGEIVHRVKAAGYVHIEEVIHYLTVINEIVVGIDMLIREHIKNTFTVKVPWNDTYVHIGRGD